MNNAGTDRRCKSCGKLLIGEKLLLCRRCVLEGRNKVGQVSGIVGGIAIAAFNVDKLLNNNSDDADDTTA